MEDLLCNKETTLWMVYGLWTWVGEGETNESAIIVFLGRNRSVQNSAVEWWRGDLCNILGSRLAFTPIVIGLMLVCASESCWCSELELVTRIGLVLAW